MYAKIENNIAVEYPLYEGDLERLFPQLQFPLDRYGTPVPEGYVRVEDAVPPEAPGPFHTVTEGMPVYDSERGAWVKTFQVNLISPSEQQEVIARQAVVARKQRNLRLNATDWTRLDDCPLTVIQKAAFAQYRQALRDLPNDPNWPYVTWPTPPEVQR